MQTIIDNKAQYTPVIQQYLTQKELAGENLLLFRLGDFYEAFFEDAEILARELEITLTSRPDSGSGTGRIPMAGIPVRSMNNYLTKLLKSGHKVAICEQLTTGQNHTHKGPIERQITRILTPGNLTESEFLDSSLNSYLASIYPLDKSDQWGFAYLDVSTSEIYISELSTIDIIHEIEKINPAELIIPIRKVRDKTTQIISNELIIPDGLNCVNLASSITERNIDTCFQIQYAYNHFGESQINGMGCKDYKAGLSALGALIDYLEFTHKDTLSTLKNIRTYQPANYLQIDKYSIKNLELFETVRTRESKYSLFYFINQYIKTKMGSRLMNHWLKYPLIKLEEIQNRQNAITELISQQANIQTLQSQLQHLNDLERLSLKLERGNVTPRDLGYIRDSLDSLLSLLQQQVVFHNSLLNFELSSNILNLIELLKSSLNHILPIHINDGGIFQQGYNTELDELRQLTDNNEQWLKSYEAEQRLLTGIKSLKVTFNKATGYYIEISKTMAKDLPEEYIIKQNLTNNNRYITDKLSEYQNKILNAESQLLNIESQLFMFLRESLKSYSAEINDLSKKIAQIDCLASLAHLAITHNYCCPNINNSNDINILNGRHIIVENTVSAGQFISNNLQFNKDFNLMILTGPNMSGKSTFMKQNALLIIMAQIGSYIPATQATIGIVDKIFTRIGANDNLSAGESTFMVEMLETGYLLNNLTERSLVILDEIGRGTSTYDGVAIAWSIVEYIAKFHTRCIFATHYHELNILESMFTNVQNYQVNVKKDSKTGELIFLHQVQQGGTNKSYGIEVAQMAGLPQQVINRANQIITQMNKNSFAIKKQKLFDESLEQIKLSF